MSKMPETILTGSHQPYSREIGLAKVANRRIPVTQGGYHYDIDNV